MLYDPHGRPIPETQAAPPRAGVSALWQDSDTDWLSAVGRGLTPESVDAIMLAADSGDTARMCALAEQIDDRSFSIGAALDTRRAAVAATRWRLEPAEASSRAEEIATAAGQMLRATHPTNELLTFNQMIQLELGSALLPGFAAPEIVWSKGGGEILGFNSVPQKHFTFVGSRTPLLVTTDRPSGMPLPPGKFVVHWHRAKGGAPTRGGLIRACAWMRCFESVTMKDMLRFVERYGMPFLVARVDEQSWKSERTVLRAIVRNFGPDGGAVLSRNTELDLLQAANTTGDVYFALLEHLEKATEKLILGQTGTSSEGGWSNNGAQHLVRMDIRSSDCGQIAETVYARILVPWVRWNYGPEAPVPRMLYDVDEAKDTQAEASVIKTLEEAGWEVEAEQIEANTGYRVTRRAIPPEDGGAPADAQEGERAGEAAAEQDEIKRLALNGAQVSALIDVIQEIASKRLPRETGIRIISRSFGLPPEEAETIVGKVGRSFFVDAGALSADASQRVCDTLATALQGNDRYRAQAAALAAESAPAEEIPERVAAAAAERGTAAAGAMLAPLQQRLDALAGIADDAQFAEALATLADDAVELFGELDTAELEAVIAETIHGAAAAGAAERAAELAGRES